MTAQSTKAPAGNRGLRGGREEKEENTMEERCAP